MTDPALYGRVLNAAGPLRRKRPRLGDIGIGNPAAERMQWVWLGTSVEDQATADERIPILLDTPAAIRWISAEPLLGPVDLEAAWDGEDALSSDCWGECAWCSEGFPPLHNCQRGKQSEAEWQKGRSGLDWVVVGGESGPGARPFDIEWARLLVSQCKAADVPVFVKQMGSRPIAMKDKGAGTEPWPLVLDSRSGTDMAEWPEDLRIQEYPVP